MCESVEEFLQVRRLLRGRELGTMKQLACRFHHRQLADPAVPLLARPEWVLDEPHAIDELVFELSTGDASDDIDYCAAGRRYLPIAANGERYGSYHQAVAGLDKPDSWFDAASYRVAGVTREPLSGNMRFTIAPSRYWVSFDATEMLAHEAAHIYRKTSGRRIDGRLRRSVVDPLDLQAHPRPSGFSTLTVRRATSGASFFLHRRNDKVAVGQNRVAVVPTGEFQPAHDSERSVRSDLSLWNAIMREYNEEFLGADEFGYTQDPPLSYVNSAPFVELNQARESGAIRCFVLAIGLDALNLKFSIHTVCVFDAEIFDSVFAQMGPANEEGSFELPASHRRRGSPPTGWSFDAATVEEQLSAERGAGSLLALRLAWRHRDALGLNFS